MRVSILKLRRDQSGATAIEYGLIAALVSIAAIGALGGMGGSLTTMFSSVANTLSCAVGGQPSEGMTCPDTGAGGGTT